MSGLALLDWLKRPARERPDIEVAGRRLPVEIRRLANARQMTLRLTPDGKAIRISLPKWGRTADALAFAEARRDWLARQIASLPVAVPLNAGGELLFRGRALRIDHDPAHPRTPRLNEGAVRVGGTAEALPGRLRRFLQREAHALLAADLVHYCQRANVPLPSLALSTAQRRWGSCSGRGMIRINWRLVMAPDAVRRSVVAHEVAHLIHFNHSPGFHACLAELFDDDLTAADAWLRSNGRGLYAAFG